MLRYYFQFWATFEPRQQTPFVATAIFLELLVLAHSFIHSVFCLTTGPKHPPKRCLHIERSRASSFKWEYPLLSLRSSSSFLRLLPLLLVTSIYPFIFPSITCFRRQFLRKMWPIQLAFRFLISCRIFLCSLTLSDTSPFLTWSVELIFSILLQHLMSKLSNLLAYNTWQYINYSLLFKVIKVKVKLALKQATKAQRGSRGRALFFP